MIRPIGLHPANETTVVHRSHPIPYESHRQGGARPHIELLDGAGCVRDRLAAEAVEAEASVLCMERRNHEATEFPHVSHRICWRPRWSRAALRAIPRRDWPSWMSRTCSTRRWSRGRSASRTPPVRRAQGGKAASNLGAGRKGAPGDQSQGRARTVQLCDIEGPGTIRHIWMTTSNNPTNLRSLVIRAWWDGQEHPSIECPDRRLHGLRPRQGHAVFLRRPLARPQRRA